MATNYLDEEVSHLRSRVTALEQLLEVREQKVREQSGRLEQALAELRQRARQLEQSETLYHSLVENLPLCVFRKDLQGRFTFANQRFCDSLARPLEQILGRTDCSFYPPELAAKYERDDRQVIETGQLFEDIEEHQKPDGSRLYVQVWKVPVHDFQGATLGTQCLFWDVTARKRAEHQLRVVARELERSNHELQQFANVVAHDLHEPLRMVTSYCRLLHGRYQGRLDANAEEFLDYAMEGATRMQELLDDLLEYARVGTRGKPFRPSDCSALLDSALANLKLAIEESGAVVTRDALPTVLADGPQLVELWQNLVANAIKFRGAEAPRIHVSAERQGDWWRFAVRDNGIGIEPRHAERIFVIFQRLHTRQEYAGTGMGLAICKKIVERHHGRIWMESTPGKGSEFYFTLPVLGNESAEGKSEIRNPKSETNPNTQEENSKRGTSAV